MKISSIPSNKPSIQSNASSSSCRIRESSSVCRLVGILSKNGSPVITYATFFYSSEIREKNQLNSTRRDNFIVRSSTYVNFIKSSSSASLLPPYFVRQTMIMVLFTSTKRLSECWSLLLCETGLCIRSSIIYWGAEIEYRTS